MVYLLYIYVYVHVYTICIPFIYHLYTILYTIYIQVIYHLYNILYTNIIPKSSPKIIQDKSIQVWEKLYKGYDKNNNSQLEEDTESTLDFLNSWNKGN